jgi:hypothetical protein
MSNLTINGQTFQLSTGKRPVLAIEALKKGARE